MRALHYNIEAFSSVFSPLKGLVLQLLVRHPSPFQICAGYATYAGKLTVPCIDVVHLSFALVRLHCIDIVYMLYIVLECTMSVSENCVIKLTFFCMIYSYKLMHQI